MSQELEEDEQRQRAAGPEHPALPRHAELRHGDEQLPRVPRPRPQPLQLPRGQRQGVRHPLQKGGLPRRLGSSHGEERGVTICIINDIANKGKRLMSKSLAITAR